MNKRQPTVTSVSAAVTKAVTLENDNFLEKVNYEFLGQYKQSQTGCCEHVTWPPGHYAALSAHIHIVYVHAKYPQFGLYTTEGTLLINSHAQYSLKAYLDYNLRVSDLGTYNIVWFIHN